MKRSCSTSLAASSLLCAALALAASRPHYGGSLHVAVKEAPQSLDLATLASDNSSNVSRLVFETLVALDDRGCPQPLLAASWQSEAGGQRWRFLLRAGVSFHDGTALDGGTAAASLRSSNPEWKVLATGDTVTIETNSPDPQLPAELSLVRNSIVRRADGKLSGTGPFVIGQWVPGKHLTLPANERYWAGRPFLDSVEVDFGKNDRDQMMMLDLGKADVIEVSPENIHRARAEGRTVATSEPEELVAIIFGREPMSDDEIHARNALAFSVDTTALNNVVLQGGGEPTGGLLPNWASGYAFVFSSPASPGRARQERMQARHLPSWTLAYDASDPISQVIAERILLNARDAGITLQLTSANSDLRLVRTRLASPEPHVALSQLARILQLPESKFSNGSVAELYSAEKGLLQSQRVIPLLYLRSAVALRPNVREWRTLPDGTWQLSNVWLTVEKP